MSAVVHPRTDSAGRRRILITGAGGRLGSAYAAHARDKYELRLQIQSSEQAEKVTGLGEIVEARLSDLDLLKKLCDGVDTIVHMAGNANPSALWTDLLRDNINGTYNLMVAAKSAGCRRVIFASSIHAVSSYCGDHQIRTSDPVNPGDLYGVSKCFGEALGRYMAEQEDLSVICVRIASCQPPENVQSERSLYMADSYLSRRDLMQLIDKSIEADNVRFAIFHGVSNNRINRLDISDARELIDYQPQDDFTAENPAMRPLKLRETIAMHNLKASHQKSGLRAELESEGT